MKGAILVMFQEVIEERFDAERWDEVLAIAELEGAYTALGSYADTEVAAITAAVAELTDQSPDQALRMLGYFGLPKLVAQLPDSERWLTDPMSFIRLVNDVVHPGVVKVYQEATPPTFDFADHPEGLLVSYRSSRNMASLAEGLLAGVTHLFDTQVNVGRVPTSDESVQFLVTLGE